MSALPPPPVPVDADLQDFPFMPLHVARLRDSDLAAEENPEACWYAVLLWAAAWHQIPAGSLPDSDAVLTRLVGLGRDARTWKKHRAGALRGFVLCDDGRLYHPVVAEQALAAWKSKVEQRHRTECARIKKANQRNGTELPCPDIGSFVSSHYPASVPFMSLGTQANVPEDQGSKREGQGQGQGQGDSKEEGSEANASGVGDADGDHAPIEPDPPAEPEIIPFDPVKAMFDAGVRLFASEGIEEKPARKLLGKWRNSHGAEAVIVALGKAQREGAIDLTSFIEGCLKNGKRQPAGLSELRGSRPDPSLDLWRQAQAELAAEGAGCDPELDRGTWIALPSQQSGRS